jgi:hypothetical protein
MTDKIIFWLSADLLPYCLSYYFQKKFNGELFAIYDLTNKPKEFFKKQNFVDFSKIWFYHDHISTKNKNNLTYLQEINKKYNLDLNELAKNDRILNKYNEYFNFSDNEINSILESECKLFENILDEIKPKYFITTETTLQPHHLFYKICKERGIKIFMLNHANWKKLCYISEERHKIDDAEKLDQINEKQFSLEEIQKLFDKSRVSKYHKKFHSEIKKSQIILVKAAIKFLFSKNDNIKTHYTYFGRNKFKVLIKEFQDKIKKYFRKKFIDKKLLNKMNNEKFIYLPLHQEPERSLLIAAPKFSDQIHTIKQISKNLPKNYQLYVKEHPTQGPARNWRKLSFYKEIMKLQNVKLFHPDFDSKSLLKNCDLVISVGGTSSFEAAFFGKPSLIFADLGYKIIPSITKLNSYSEVKQAIVDSLKIQVNPKDVVNYIKILEDNSFEFDILHFETKYQNTFYMNGNLVDVNFDDKIMGKFLLENNEELEILANEFIRKIYQFKKGVDN